MTIFLWNAVELFKKKIAISENGSVGFIEWYSLNLQSRSNFQLINKSVPVLLRLRNFIWKCLWIKNKVDGITRSIKQMTQKECYLSRQENYCWDMIQSRYLHSQKKRSYALLEGWECRWWRWMEASGWDKIHIVKKEICPQFLEVI